MSFFPLALQLEGKSILIVGGGRVATHKLKAISQYCDGLTILAPEVSDALRGKGYRIIEKRFEAQDIQGYFLVYACTNEKETNAEVARVCRRANILVNVADDPVFSDFISPAIYKEGSMSVAITSDGKDVRRSLDWREKIKQALR